VGTTEKERRGISGIRSERDGQNITAECSGRFLIIWIAVGFTAFLGYNEQNEVITIFIFRL